MFNKSGSYDDAVLLGIVDDYEKFAADQDALCACEVADPAEEERLGILGRRVGADVAAQPAATAGGLRGKLRIVVKTLEWDDASLDDRIKSASCVSDAVVWSIMKDLLVILPAQPD